MGVDRFEDAMDMSPIFVSLAVLILALLGIFAITAFLSNRRLREMEELHDRWSERR